MAMLKRTFEKMWIAHVHKVGQRALSHPRLPWVLIFFTVLWSICGIFELLSGSTWKGLLDIAIGILALLGAFTWCERKEFYQLIQSQKEQILELESRIIRNQEKENNHSS